MLQVRAEQSAQFLSRGSAERGRCTPLGEIAVGCSEDAGTHVPLGRGGGGGGGRIGIHRIGIAIRLLRCIIGIIHRLGYIRGIRGHVNVRHLAFGYAGQQVIGH
jgi:hypothetical protein